MFRMVTAPGSAGSGGGGVVDMKVVGTGFVTTGAARLDSSIVAGGATRADSSFAGASGFAVA